MISEGIFDYLLLVIQVINIIAVICMFYFLFNTYKKRKGKSMEHVFYLAFLAFILIFAATATDILHTLPAMRWDIIRAFSLLVLMVTYMYMLKYLNRTIEGYEEAIKIKSGKKEVLKGMGE